MSDVDFAVFELYRILVSISPIHHLNHREVQHNSLSGYMLLTGPKSPKGAVFRFFWDDKEKVVAVHRLQRDGSDGKALAARITVDASLGDDIELRGTTRKEGNSRYQVYGAFTVGFTCPTKLAYNDALNALRHLERGLLQAAEPGVTLEEAAKPPPVGPSPQPPPQSDTVPTNQTPSLLPAVEEYTALTSEDTRWGGRHFYATIGGQVFSYRLDQIGYMILEELFVKASTPRKMMYLSQPPSTQWATRCKRSREGAWMSIGPFDHIISTKEEMTPTQVRTLFNLPSRHRSTPAAR